MRTKTDTNMAHVLYQRLGKDWYAFTEVDGDCYMTKLDENFIHTDTTFENVQDLVKIFPQLRNKKLMKAA